MKTNRSRTLAVLGCALVAGSLWVSAGYALDLSGMSKLTGGGAKDSGASAKVDPDSFLHRAQTAEELLHSSLWGMSKALLSKEKLAELQAQQEKANQVTDPKEKEAQQQAVSKSVTAALNEAASDSALKSRIDKIDADRKQLLAGSAYNFALGVLQEKVLSDESKGLISGMGSNPSMLSKLGKVKDAAASIGNQLSIHASLAGKMPAVFSAVSVQAPTSVDEKPKTIMVAKAD